MGNPEKSKGRFLCGAPKTLGKERKNSKKAREIGNKKKQGNRKKKGLEGQGLGPKVGPEVGLSC